LLLEALSLFLDVSNAFAELIFCPAHKNAQSRIGTPRYFVLFNCGKKNYFPPLRSLTGPIVSISDLGQRSPGRPDLTCALQITEVPMIHQSNSKTHTILLFTLLSLLSVAALQTNFSANAYVFSTSDGEHQRQFKNSDTNKHKEDHSATSIAGASLAPTTHGRPVIRVDRGDISTLDLSLGIGSNEGMPKPPFKFEKEDTSGTNPKIKVIDANGVKWNVKFDEEVHAEIAASRIVWAFGYNVEESYYIPSAQIDGVHGLGRAKKFVSANGAIRNAMFEKRPHDIARRNEPWSWSSNPFSGSREMSGLILLNVLVNNWDAKQTNNGVLSKLDKNGTVDDWYTVCDWGGTFGKYSSIFSHSKWSTSDFAKQSYVEGVSGNTLRLHYSGKMGGSHSVPLEHARWFVSLANQLTDDQLRQAFKASGASESEVASFSNKIREKLNELKRVTGQ